MGYPYMITLPSLVQSGDKLIISLTMGGTSTAEAPPGWTEVKLPLFRRFLNFIRRRQTYVFTKITEAHNGGTSLPLLLVI